jgi:drug/metabolite transporter (DMT)-like permease
VPFVLALATTILAVSAMLGRAGVARPDRDVVQFIVRWGGRERELTPLSLGASVLQFLLSIVTLPAARLLPPSVLYRPELAPSAGAVLVAVGTAVVTSALAWALWSGRIDRQAPREQQREAEQNS